MSKQSLDKSLMQVFEDKEAGTPDDKMRLFLIYYICSPQLPESEVDEYANVLQVRFFCQKKGTCLFDGSGHFFQEIGADLAPLQYLKRWKSLSQMTSLPTTDYSGGGLKTVSSMTMINSWSWKFMEGVKNLVVKKHNLPITKIVDELMEVCFSAHL